MLKPDNSVHYCKDVCNIERSMIIGIVPPFEYQTQKVWYPDHYGINVFILLNFRLDSILQTKMRQTFFSRYYLRANVPSLSLSPPYLYSCKVAPRPPCFITHMSDQSLNSRCKEQTDESPEVITCGALLVGRSTM